MWVRWTPNPKAVGHCQAALCTQQTIVEHDDDETKELYIYLDDETRELT